MKKITVGNLQSKPGKRVYGYLDILEHPVGTVERLPVIIAQGMNVGPTLWLTANIHGDEYTGIPVIHKVINTIDLTKLKGTIVAIPTLNPAGSRVCQRHPYYDKKDPNRLFPDGNPFKDKESSDSSEVILTEKEEDLGDDLSIKTESQVEITIIRELTDYEIWLCVFEFSEESFSSNSPRRKLFELMKDSLVDRLSDTFL